MIAIDWGTSSLRGWLLDEAGNVLDRRRADIGALGHGERCAEILSRQIEGWSDAQIVMCGMVGARGGWREAAYVECPAGAQAIAAAMLRVETDATALQDRIVRIVPGMVDRRSSSVADVMRGEETQIVGLLPVLQEPFEVVCLPGTHSKWVGIRDGRVASIRTAMTGETYALFRTHSVLARSMAAHDDAFDGASFDAGLRRSADAGGLLHHLFGVRTQGLFGQLSPEQAPSWLSGLLIGHEIREQLPLPQVVHLVGNDRLATAYARALAALDIETRSHSEQSAASGMRTLLQAAAP